MINLLAIKNSTLLDKPFQYSLICNMLSQAQTESLLKTIPKTNYSQSSRKTGSDKTYNVANNLLKRLDKPRGYTAPYLSEEWELLTKELQSDQYIEELSKLMKVDLSSCYQEITMKRYGFDNYISPHTDKKQVKATHMIFLNKDWDENWGGQLCFLKDSSTVIKRFLPVYSQSVMFIRSENSWHSVEKVTIPGKERIAIQVAFWNIIDRTILPGRNESEKSFD